MVFPRYFTARAGGDPRVAGGGVVHVIDAFTLQTSRVRTEWVVGIDRSGIIEAQRLDPLDDLSPGIRNALAFHEVSGGARRVIELKALYLFEMRLLEQAPDCPGVNDPVYLYGTLVGPLTASPEMVAPPIHRQEGQLTVSRGDVLTGLVTGAGWAFRCAEPNGARSARVLSMLMGADRYEAVVAGHGAVIVYPMLGVDPDFYAIAPGNEEIVSRVLYDLLHAWWTDMAREAPPAFRSPDSLPIPNRPEHEQRLARLGFEIDGDVAVRPRAGWAGVLPGRLGRESRQVPPEGDADDFLKLAAEALVKAPEWPSASGSALYARVRSGSGAGERALPPSSRAPRRIDLGGLAVPDWMRSFIAERAQPPHLTPGPDNPALPRALPPLDPAVGANAAAVLDQLASRFDKRGDR